MKLFKNSLKLIMGLALVICCMQISSFAVNAEAKAKAPVLKTSGDYHYFVATGNTFVYDIGLFNVNSDAKVTDVKASNNKVSNLSYNSSARKIYFNANAKGTCVISCKVKQNNRTYKVSKKITIYSGYPFASIKINNKEVNDKSGKSNLFSINVSAKRAKINVRLKSGWKIHKMYYAYFDQNGRSPEKTIKNGATVTLKGNRFCIFIKAKNTSGKIYHSYVQINR